MRWRRSRCSRSWWGCGSPPRSGGTTLETAATGVEAVASRPVIGFTDWAEDILRRTHEAARRFNPAVTVRLHRARDGVAFDLADERTDGDELVQGNGFELWVEGGLEGTV